jgi:hypothetical protein
MAGPGGNTGPAWGTAAGIASDALRDARARRVALGAAMARAEQSLAAPCASPQWRSEVRASLVHLRLAIDSHVAEVESETGLLGELRQVAPRLSGPIDQVAAEHQTLCRAADAALDASEEATIDEVRARVLNLLLALARHRQRGADLVYEAFNVDIGGQ